MAQFEATGSKESDTRGNQFQHMKQSSSGYSSGSCRDAVGSWSQFPNLRYLSYMSAATPFFVRLGPAVLLFSHTS